MRQPMPLRVRILFFCGLAILLVVLIWGLWAGRDLVNNLIVIPLGVLLWAFGLFLRSVPQSVYWAIFILIFLILAARGLGLTETTRAPQEELPGTRARRERVGFWLLQVLMARRGKTRSRFGDLFGRLCMDVLAQMNHKTPIRMERDLAEQPGDVPAAILRYVEYRRNKGLNMSKTLWERITLVLGKGNKPEMHFSEKEMDEILNYFEEQLEVKRNEDR